MFDLKWRILTVLILCLLFSILSFGQVKGTYNYLDFANKPYYFGMTLGFNSSQYRVVHGQEFIQHDTIYSVESPRGPGFNLGFIANLKIGRHFDFRFSPAMSFASRSLIYQMEKSAEQEMSKQIDALFLEVPFQIRYKSEPYQDFRLFVIAGVKYSFDAASNSNTRQSASILKIAPSDFAVEYGVGIQFFLPYFIFSPEFKVSQGISNVLITDNKLIYSSVLDRITSRVFTLSLHFEG